LRFYVPVNLFVFMNEGKASTDIPHDFQHRLHVQRRHPIQRVRLINVLLKIEIAELHINKIPSFKPGMSINSHNILMAWLFAKCFNYSQFVEYIVFREVPRRFHQLSCKNLIVSGQHWFHEQPQERPHSIQCFSSKSQRHPQMTIPCELGHKLHRQS